MRTRTRITKIRRALTILPNESTASFFATRLFDKYYLVLIYVIQFILILTLITSGAHQKQLNNFKYFTFTLVTIRCQLITSRTRALITSNRVDATFFAFVQFTFVDVWKYVRINTMRENCLRAFDMLLPKVLRHRSFRGKIHHFETVS